jgi:FkbM family methyltransferase
MSVNVWTMRFKRAVSSLATACGYDFERQEAYSKRYRLVHRLRLGYDPQKDVKKILGHSLHCIFDVGAHVGQSALAFADSFPNAIVYSFEPSIDSFIRLAEIAKCHPRIRAIHSALGDDIGEALFYINKFSQTNSILATLAGIQDLLIAPDQMNLQSTTHVQVMTLDRFCIDQKITKIDLLKIDTQGYELKVLEGGREFLRQNIIPLIYIEVCFVPYYENQPLFPEVYGYLYALGYRLVGLYESGFRTHYYRLGGNALFVHESVGKRL